MFVSDTHKFAFVHIPKCAGITVRNSLSMYGDDRKEQPPFHAPLRDVTLPEDYFTFSFVRNPWDRLVSAYTFTKAQCQEDPERCYRNGYGDIVNQSFTEWLYSEMWEDGYGRDTHPPYQRRTNLWYLRDGDKEVDFIGKVENFDKDFAEAVGRIGLNFVRIQPANIHEHDPYQAYYTSETRDVVGEWFKEDIERFGYDF